MGRRRALLAGSQDVHRLEKQTFGLIAMVLVSFQKQFIYTKTNKTADTSVEVFFEPECLPPEGYEQAHFNLFLAQHDTDQDSIGTSETQRVIHTIFDRASVDHLLYEGKTQSKE